MHHSCRDQFEHKTALREISRAQVYEINNKTSHIMLTLTPISVPKEPKAKKPKPTA